MVTLFKNHVTRASPFCKKSHPDCPWNTLTKFDVRRFIRRFNRFGTFGI